MAEFFNDIGYRAMALRFAFANQLIAVGEYRLFEGVFGPMMINGAEQRRAWSLLFCKRRMMFLFV